MERNRTLTITGFPVPPTVNRLYMHSYRNNRMIKTKDYRDFEGQVSTWRLTNTGQINNIRVFLKDIGTQVLHVGAIFNVSKKSIVCLNGKPKRNDTSNRLKALHDALSSVIGVDDCYFWSGTFDKVSVDGPESVTIELRLREI